MTEFKDGDRVWVDWFRTGNMHKARIIQMTGKGVCLLEMRHEKPRLFYTDLLLPRKKKWFGF